MKTGENLIAGGDAVGGKVELLEQVVGDVHVGDALLGDARQFGGGGAARQLAQFGQHQRRLGEQRQRRQVQLLFGQRVAPRPALNQGPRAKPRAQSSSRFHKARCFNG